MKRTHHPNHFICALLLSCAPTPAPSPVETKNAYTLEGDVVTVPLKGFILTCQDKPTIWLNDASGKRQANLWLPPKGGFYLDGSFIERSMGCDKVQCQEETRNEVKLIEYQKTGERTSPEGYQLAEYKTTPLTGALTIEFPYFDDKDCQQPKTYSITISRTD